MLPYFFQEPRGRRRPVLLSCPHTGTEFPPEVAERIRPRYRERPEDTDWLIHELYGFAPELGIAVIHARYSRYVIDLNRDPGDRPLYRDGRRETSLVPVRSFRGDPLYDGWEPDAAERDRRRESYYVPYHRRIEAELASLRREFPHVLFYDAHSIARHVPTIRPEPFPDLILGSGGGTTAAPALVETALGALARGRYSVAHNDPFQGGYLTRNFGRPSEGVHALQLEMSQDIYLEDPPPSLHPGKAPPLQALLRETLESLARAVEGMA